MYAFSHVVRNKHLLFRACILYAFSSSSLSILSSFLSFHCISSEKQMRMRVKRYASANNRKKQKKQQQMQKHAAGKNLHSLGLFLFYIVGVEYKNITDPETMCVVRYTETIR